MGFFLIFVLNLDYIYGDDFKVGCGFFDVFFFLNVVFGFLWVIVNVVRVVNGLWVVRIMFN